MAKVSGALKYLIKTVIWIKNKNLEASEEKVVFDKLRERHPINYHEAMSKYMKEPWSRLLK